MLAKIIEIIKYSKLEFIRLLIHDLSNWKSKNALDLCSEANNSPETRFCNGYFHMAFSRRIPW